MAHPMPDPVATVTAGYDVILAKWAAFKAEMKLGELPKRRKRIAPAQPAWMMPCAVLPPDKEPAHLAEFRAKMTWEAVRRDMKQLA